MGRVSTTVILTGGSNPTPSCRSLAIRRRSTGTRTSGIDRPSYADPSGHAFASPEGGASGAIAVAVGYALGSQAGQALNVAVAEAQAFVQSLGLQLGNLFPAVTDQFVNPGQVSGTASSSGGKMAGSDGPPEDPFPAYRMQRNEVLVACSAGRTTQYSDRSRLSSATQSCRILGVAGSISRCRRDW